MAGEEPYISDRKVVLCPATEDLAVPDLLEECPNCESFFLYCCSCNIQNLKKPEHQRPTYPCHHYRIIFTDGACINNGQTGAKAGIGIAGGYTGSHHLSVPITRSLDAAPVRSSQRAELLAAIYGLVVLSKVRGIDSEGVEEPAADGTKAWVIATDSEYVAKGMTEWFPTWKKNNWRTSKGSRPANLDLFRSLDRKLTKYEERGIVIGFWRIPRENNTLADGLAKAAAVSGDVATG